MIGCDGPYTVFCWHRKTGGSGMINVYKDPMYNTPIRSLVKHERKEVIKPVIKEQVWYWNMKEDDKDFSEVIKKGMKLDNDVVDSTIERPGENVGILQVMK